MVFWENIHPLRKLLPKNSMISKTLYDSSIIPDRSRRRLNIGTTFKNRHHREKKSFMKSCTNRTMENDTKLCTILNFALREIHEISIEFEC